MSPRRENIPRFSDDSPQVITPKNIALPLWFSWAITTTFVAGTITLMTFLASLNAKLDAASSDRWKRSYMREHDNQMRRSNPTITVPDADEIAHKME